VAALQRAQPRDERGTQKTRMLPRPYGILLRQATSERGRDKVKTAGGTPALLKPVNDGQESRAYRNSMADLPDAPDSPGAETDYDSLVFYWPPRATRRTLCRQGASAAAIWGYFRQARRTISDG
jgi:hypothetical protein